jgi:hypothetical protein
MVTMIMTIPIVIELGFQAIGIEDGLPTAGREFGFPAIGNGDESPADFAYS